MTKEPEKVQLTVITQEIDDPEDLHALSSSGASAGGGESSDGEGDIEIEHVGDEAGSTGSGVHGLAPAGNITFDIRRRTLINIYQRTILEEFYRCGMTSASLMLSHLHTSAAEKTGLDISVVKNWIRNRRRPTAARSAEKFAEKIAQGSLPPVPTIPNVPSLSSIGLPTTSNLCSESTPSTSVSSALTNQGRSVAAHLMPEPKRICTESGHTLPTHYPIAQQTQHPQQLHQPVSISLHPSPLTSTTHHLHSSSVISPTPHSTTSVSMATNGAGTSSSTSISSIGPVGSSNPTSASVITNGATVQDSLLVKVRISGSGESDFVEVEVPSLTYSSLLKSISEELEVATHEIAKVRKLPNVWVRKDKDVQRLKEGQELEVIVKSGSSNNPTPPPPITSILTVNPFSVSPNHSIASNTFSLLTSVANAHHGGGLALRTDSDGGLLAALTSDGPVSMPDLTNVGGANRNTSQMNGLH